MLLKVLWSLHSAHWRTLKRWSKRLKMHLSRVDKRVYAAVHDVVQNHDNQLI